MENERRAPLNPKDHRHTIESLMKAEGHPPKVGSLEMDRLLRSVNIAPYSVLDALRSGVVPGRGHREVSRFASKVTWDRISQRKDIERLRTLLEEYNQLKGKITERERRRYDKALEAIMRSYQPFSPEKITSWWWDTETKDNAAGLLSDASLPLNLFFALIAESLSETTGLDEDRVQCLLQDYWAGVAHINLVTGAAESFIKTIKDQLAAKETLC